MRRGELSAFVDDERRGVCVAEASAGAVAPGFSSVPDVLAVASASGAAAFVAFSAWAWLRVFELLRRGEVVFVSCSWLTVVAFSVLGRVVRLRVGFACSCVSGDSDVFFMKKTPFCILVWPHHLSHCADALFTVVCFPLASHASFTGGDGRRKSLFTATKKDCRNPHRGMDRPSRRCSARHRLSALSGVGLWLLVHSVAPQTLPQLPSERGAVPLIREEIT